MTTPTLNIPKSIKLSTVITRDNKTCILLNDNVDENVNWTPWYSVVVGIEDYKKWSKLQTNIVGIVINYLPDKEEYYQDLYQISKNVSIVLITNDILNRKSADFWADNYDNVMDINYFHEQYPFMGNCWDGTPSDAVAMIAMLMRFNNIVNYNIVNCPLSQVRRQPILDKLGIKVLPANAKPNKCWLFTQFFRHQNNRRYKEIKECLSKNCENPLIDRIVLINEKDLTGEWSNIKNSDKIQQVITGKRLTYSDFISHVNNLAPDDCYTILANADIYFDNGIKELWRTNMADKMLGLLRWDVQEDRDDPPKIFGPRSDSQDSWIFLSNSIKSKKWDFSVIDYRLGQPGCDNRFMYDCLKMKFLLANPSLTLKSYHIHNTNIRNYSKMDYIESPFYIYADPSHIVDSKQVLQLDKPSSYLNNESVEFEVKSSSVSNGITYCTLLEKLERFKWEPGVENFYFEKIPLHTWKNACVTTNGLVYDMWNLYTGKYKQELYWGKTDVNIFTELQERSRIFAIPFEDNSVFNNLDSYLVNYASRVARLLKLYPGTSFWVPPNFVDCIKCLNWPSDSLNALVYNNGTAGYANEVVGWLPGQYELGREDVEALRELNMDWINKPIGKKCVVLADNSVINMSVFKTIKELVGNEQDWSFEFIFGNNNDPDAYYDKIRGASLCIFVGGNNKREHWSKLWMLPEDCCVLEFQKESEISGEFQHFAHISNFKSWIYLFPNNKYGHQLSDYVCETIGKWMKKNSDELVE